MMRIGNLVQRQRIFDRTVELLLIVLCLAASVYGLARLAAEPLLA